jgi:hypothetical protein
MLIAKCQQRIKQYLDFLEKQCYTPVAALPIEAAETRQLYRTVPQDLEWKSVEMPFFYGKEWMTYWLRTHYTIAEQDKGKRTLSAHDPAIRMSGVFESHTGFGDESLA